MSDRARDRPEVPEPDALEQEPDEDEAELPDEVGDRPEADAIEQARALRPHGDDADDEIGLRPEADVLDQRRDAGVVDEEDHGR